MRLAFPGLMAALAGGETIVTPTPLLAAAANEQFTRSRLAADCNSWETPLVLSRDVWMANCWHRARSSLPNIPVLLSPSQERELWRQIIEQDRPDLFNAGAMASLAQRTSGVMGEHLISAEGPAWLENADAEKFLHWHQTLEHRLRADNWITSAHLWRLIPGWIGKGVVKAESVTFAALTSVSPGLQRLQQRLAGLQPSVIQASAFAHAFESVAHEIDHAARAARHLLEAGQASSIGILVPDLKTHARDLKRIFSEVFYPGGQAGDHFHIQSGALAAEPLIANALLLLELARPRVSHASAGAILRSSFVEGSAKERSARALAESRLLRARELDFSIADLERASAGCPVFSNVLKRLRAVTSKMLPSMRLSDWSVTFSSILEAARWPAVDALTNAESRLLDEWSKALSKLAALGLVAPPVPLNTALTHLRSFLNRPARQGDWSSPVQVLDAAESEGIEFDHAFLLNACEAAWPSPMPLSPLIPYALQRLHQVPGSNPEGLAEERLRKTENLIRSASQVRASFTGKLSPALRSFTELPAGASTEWNGLTAAQSYPPVGLEAQEDSLAPALAQSDEFRGGSGVIKAQSLCPFKAFAEYRLLARREEDACFGLDALERGNFAHKALELVWRKLQTQTSLKALATDELQTLVADCVTQAVTDNGTGPIRTLTSEAERERLTTVLLDWLAIEKVRPVSFSVEHVEEKQTVDLAGLKLSLRVDRIDRLSNGHLVLIDYKTGAQTRTKLEGARPKEPQLLVYAAAVADPVDGLYFAELKNRDPRAVGHASGKHFQKGAVTDHKNEWPNFLRMSRQSVERLASGFQQGQAAVVPLAGACDYCKVKPLCRIRTAGPAEEEEE